jgi:hypothetical protein
MPLSDEEKRDFLDLMERREAARLAGEMDFVSQGAITADAAGRQLTDIGSSALGGMWETATMPAALAGQLPSAAGLSPFDEGWNQDLMQQAARGREEIGPAMIGHTPKTAAGRYTKSVAANLPLMWLGPGSMGMKGWQALMSGLGAQSFDDFVAGGDASQGGNVLARIAGSLVGGAAPTWFAGKIPNADLLLNQTMKGMTEDDWAKASALKSNLDNLGVGSHLNTQLLGPRSAADDVVSMASGQAATRPPILGKVAGASDEVSNTVDNWIAQNLFPTLRSSREFRQDLKHRAHRVIQRGEAEANRAYSDGMPPSVAKANYAPDRVQRMHTELLDVVNEFGPTSPAGKSVLKLMRENLIDDVTGMPVANRNHLNEIYKSLNALMKDNPVEYGKLPLAKVRAILGNYTGDFKGAREAKERVMRDTVNPMKTGLVGEIATTGGPVKLDKYTSRAEVLGKIFSKQRQVEEINALADHLGDSYFTPMVAEYLRKTADEVLTRNVPAQGVAKLGDTLLKTRPLADNLEAAVRASARLSGTDSTAVWSSFRKMVEALDTFRDAKVAPGLNPADITQLAGFSPTAAWFAPHSRIGRILWDRAARDAFAKITDLATSPDGLKKLEKLYQLDPKGHRISAVVRYALGTALQANLTEPLASPMLPAQKEK